MANSNSNSNCWDLYEKLRNERPVSRPDQPDQLSSVAQLVKDYEINIGSIASDRRGYCDQAPALACIIELESRWQEQKGLQCKVPKVIDVTLHAWKFDDDLWYPTRWTDDGVCPKCGHIGECTYFPGQVAFNLCKCCKVRWDSKYPPVPTRLPQDCNSDLLTEALAYTPAEEIYKKSVFGGQPSRGKYFLSLAQDIEDHRSHDEPGDPVLDMPSHVLEKLNQVERNLRKDLW